MAASLVLAGCPDDGSGVESTGPGTGTGESTGAITTFQPSTTVDPSATLTDSSSDTGDSGLDTSGTTDGGSGTSSGESTSGTTGGDAPSVQATSPGDREVGVPAATAVEVTFSEMMDSTTITTNTADDTCSGALQLSADDFVSCVRMSGAPTSADDLTFSVTPAAPLSSVGTYQVRVLGEVTDAGGTPMGADFTTATGFVVRYFHTIVMDGVNDFTADETFSTSTAGHTGYVAWDEAYVYLGMDSPDLAANSNQIWLVGYLGGAMGTTAGVTYNTQQPLLPFDARWHVRWRASDDFGGALEWTGAAWTDPGFGPTAGSDDVAVGGAFVELRVAWSDLGDPDGIDFHLGMLREQNLNEASWGAVPEGSYVDGYDPDYTQYFALDRLSSMLPAEYAPM